MYCVESENEDADGDSFFIGSSKTMTPLPLANKQVNFGTTTSPVPLTTAVTPQVMRLPVPDGSGSCRYPAPNINLFIFDPSTGFRFDTFTGLYYDANSGYFINNALNILLRWDATEFTYLKVDTAGGPCGNEEPPTTGARSIHDAQSVTSMQPVVSAQPTASVQSAPTVQRLGQELCSNKTTDVPYSMPNRILSSDDIYGMSTDEKEGGSPDKGKGAIGLENWRRMIPLQMMRTSARRRSSSQSSTSSKNASIKRDRTSPKKYCRSRSRTPSRKSPTHSRNSRRRRRSRSSSSEIRTRRRRMSSTRIDRKRSFSPGRKKEFNCQRKSPNNKRGRRRLSSESLSFSSDSSPSSQKRRRRGSRQRSFSRDRKNKSPPVQNPVKCHSCDEAHKTFSCPAQNNYCRLCKVKGHYERCCSLASTISNKRANDRAGRADSKYIDKAIFKNENPVNLQGQKGDKLKETLPTSMQKHQQERKMCYSTAVDEKMNFTGQVDVVSSDPLTKRLKAVCSKEETKGQLACTNIEAMLPGDHATGNSGQIGEVCFSCHKMGHNVSNCPEFFKVGQLASRPFEATASSSMIVTYPSKVVSASTALAIGNNLKKATASTSLDITDTPKKATASSPLAAADPPKKMTAFTSAGVADSSKKITASTSLDIADTLKKATASSSLGAADPPKKLTAPTSAVVADTAKKTTASSSLAVADPSKKMTASTPLAIEDNASTSQVVTENLPVSSPCDNNISRPKCEQDIPYYKLLKKGYPSKALIVTSMAFLRFQKTLAAYNRDLKLAENVIATLFQTLKYPGQKSVPKFTYRADIDKKGPLGYPFKYGLAVFPSQLSAITWLAACTINNKVEHDGQIFHVFFHHQLWNCPSCEKPNFWLRRLCFHCCRLKSSGLSPIREANEPSWVSVSQVPVSFDRGKIKKWMIKRNTPFKSIHVIKDPFTSEHSGTVIIQPINGCEEKVFQILQQWSLATPCFVYLHFTAQCACLPKASGDNPLIPLPLFSPLVIDSGRVMKFQKSAAVVLVGPLPSSKVEKNCPVGVMDPLMNAMLEAGFFSDFTPQLTVDIWDKDVCGAPFHYALVAVAGGVPHTVLNGAVSFKFGHWFEDYIQTCNLYVSLGNWQCNYCKFQNNFPLRSICFQCGFGKLGSNIAVTRTQNLTRWVAIFGIPFSDTAESLLSQVGVAGVTKSTFMSMRLIKDPKMKISSGICLFEAVSPETGNLLMIKLSSCFVSRVHFADVNMDGLDELSQNVILGTSSVNSIENLEEPGKPLIERVSNDSPDGGTASETQLSQQCTYCGLRNHTVKDCRKKPNVCSNCKKIGHLLADCRLPMKEPSQKKQEEESKVVSFNKNKVFAQKKKFCYVCGYQSHSSAECKIGVKYCSKCSGKGHSATNCPLTEQEYSETQIEEGLNASFPNNEAPSKAPVCYFCGLAGHLASKCYIKQRVCYNCMGRGHIAIYCPNPTRNPKN